MKKITINNYEPFALDYLEDNLSMEDRIEFEDFLFDHPDIKEDLEAMQLVILPQPEQMVFPKKEALYREERPTRKLAWVPILRIAAALMFLITMSVILWPSLQENSNMVQPEVALETGKKESNKNDISTEKISEEIKAKEKEVTFQDIKNSNKDRLKVVSKEVQSKTFAQIKEEHSTFENEVMEKSKLEDFEKFDVEKIDPLPSNNRTIAAVPTLDKTAFNTLKSATKSNFAVQTNALAQTNPSRQRSFEIVLPKEVYPETWKEEKAITINTSFIPKSFIPESFLK